MSQTEIVTEEFFKEPMAMGNIFAESGMWPDVKTAAQAAVKILAGKELNLSPFESMAGIYQVGNRLTLNANMMATLLKRSKKYDYSIEEHSEEICKISFYKRGETGKTEDDTIIGTSVFTFKDAAKAGIVNKDNWKNYPRNMLFARALANGVRWYCPDAVSGYYTTEEIQDIPSGPVSAMTTVELTAEGEVK